MNERRGDHIALILSQETVQLGPRKKYRRYWNQLSRCQKNFIVLTIITAALTVLTFLPGEHVVTDPVVKDQRKFKIVSNDVERRPIGTLDEVHHNQIDDPNPAENDQVTQTTMAPGFNPIPLQEEDSDALEGKQLEDNFDLPNTEKRLTDRMKELLDKVDEMPIKPAMTFKGPTNERQRAVVNAFKHSWQGYREYAWGHDNLKPISASFSDWFGLGLTITDSLDTMYLMNLQTEFEEARNWVDSYLEFKVNRDVNLFEITIRILGGLLAAYHFSGDKMFLRKSVDLGVRLLPCFDSPSGIPYSDVNLATMKAHSPKWSPDSSTSEVTTLQLEFRDLSRTVGSSLFENVVQRVNEKVHALEKKDGLVPIFINANSGTFRYFSTISLGARGDSYYEYLLKQWIQTGRKPNDFLIADYVAAINGVIEHLVRKTPKDGLTFVGELINGKEFKPKMDHLTCYLPGTLILGHKYGMPESHLNLAKQLLNTCYQTYVRQPTGLAPEITYFSVDEADASDIQVKSNDAHNLLRPEFVESLYYFYVLTGNSTYQDMAWKVFEAFEKYTKVKHGYTSIGNVKNVQNTRPRDMMESFWLGETLKYLYLIFSDDREEIDLEKYVFNSEAHPLPIRSNEFY